MAQRLERFTSIVGPRRVIAATDCGLSSAAGASRLDPDIAWAKLESLVAGARMSN
jgi:5-methyltetrahydropteroyltriglutamate--homocysteine methyltransferase